MEGFAFLEVFYKKDFRKKREWYLFKQENLFRVSI